MEYIELTVRPNTLPRFTTLLQTGIGLKGVSGEAIGVFLSSLPGFDIDYIADRLQTIFIDGNAVDDLETVLTSPGHVLALSAAMPGLAGAIFRRNSLCSALRSVASHAATVSTGATEIYIRLKLFNMIALEKGPAVLHRGGLFSGESLKNFFTERPDLLDDITAMEIDGGPNSEYGLITRVSPEKFIHLTIKPSPAISTI